VIQNPKSAARHGLCVTLQSLQSSGGYCNTPQYTATHCNTTDPVSNVAAGIATHCSTLQHGGSAARCYFRASSLESIQRCTVCCSMLQQHHMQRVAVSHAPATFETFVFNVYRAALPQVPAPLESPHTFKTSAKSPTNQPAPPSKTECLTSPPLATKATEGNQN